MFLCVQISTIFMICIDRKQTQIHAYLKGYVLKLTHRAPSKLVTLVTSRTFEYSLWNSNVFWIFSCANTYPSVVSNCGLKLTADLSVYCRSCRSLFFRAYAAVLGTSTRFFHSMNHNFCCHFKGTVTEMIRQKWNVHFSGKSTALKSKKAKPKPTAM